MAGTFFDALMATAFGEPISRSRRERDAHAVAASRPGVWDAATVRDVLTIYDPLPTTGASDRIYLQVAELLCDGLAPADWLEYPRLKSELSEELSRRSREEPVACGRVKNAAHRLAKEYRHYREYCGRYVGE